MNLIAPDTRNEVVLLAWYRFLAFFFDGASHLVGAGQLVPSYFPLAEILLPKQVAKMTYPRIVLGESSSSPGKARRYTYGRQQSQTFTMNVMLFVPAKLSQTVNGQVLAGWRLHDRCAALLELLFQNVRWSLGDRDVHIVSADTRLPLTDREHEFAISAQSVVVRVPVRLLHVSWIILRNETGEPILTDAGSEIGVPV